MGVLTPVLFAPTGAEGILMAQSISLSFWRCHAYFPPHAEEVQRLLLSPGPCGLPLTSAHPSLSGRFPISSEEQISLPSSGSLALTPPPGSFHAGLFPSLRL